MESCNRPNRSDIHLTVEEEAKLEAKTREFFDESAPKRHTKPQRSEYSSQYVDALSPSNNNKNEDSIPELLQFQRLENDPQVGLLTLLPNLAASLCSKIFRVKIKTKNDKNASAGSRTRVYCLEGNYPNRWTTNASCSLFLSKTEMHTLN